MKKHRRPSVRQHFKPSAFLRVEVLEDRTLLDAAGPRVVELTPQEVRNAVFDHVDVRFNEALDARTFALDDVLITGADGPATLTGIEQLAADQFRVTFGRLS